MKEIIRNNIVDLPYCLHDAHINNIVVEENKVILNFVNGFYHGEVLVHGHIEFENVDFDYCNIYILNNNGKLGSFRGKKMELEQFIKKHSKFDMEIIDECYGYNKSKFYGWMYEKHRIQEFLIEIYHLGNMKYITEE